MNDEEFAERYPNLQKEKEARDEGSQLIGEFIDWLPSVGLRITGGDDPVRRSPHSLLCMFFDIDEKEVERERTTLLQEFVASQQQQSDDSA